MGGPKEKGWYTATGADEQRRAQLVGTTIPARGGSRTCNDSQEIEIDVLLNTGLAVVVQAAFELKGLLPQPPETWEHGCAPSDPVRCF